MPLSIAAEQRKDATSARYYAKRKNLFTAAHVAHLAYIVRKCEAWVSDSCALDVLKEELAKGADCTVDAFMTRHSNVVRPEFQHRHFAVIAAAIKVAGDRTDLGNHKTMVSEFCDTLRDTNAKFDVYRFQHACGW